jgi:hydrogenase maturation protease
MRGAGWEYGDGLLNGIRTIADLADPAGAPAVHACAPAVRACAPAVRARATPVPARALLIGYGNLLRGDDGAGVRLARQVRRGGLGPLPPAVAVREQQQLTPELAEELGHWRSVLFLDAWWAPPGSAPVLEAIRPALAAAHSHRLDPAALLGLSASLYGRAPEAWLLRLPAHRFGHGTALSAELRRCWPEAQRLLCRWLADHA